MESLVLYLFHRSGTVLLFGCSVGRMRNRKMAFVLQFLLMEELALAPLVFDVMELEDGGGKLQHFSGVCKHGGGEFSAHLRFIRCVQIMKLQNRNGYHTFYC